MTRSIVGVDHLNFNLLPVLYFPFMDLVYHIIIRVVLLGASPFILLRMAVSPAFRASVLERIRGGQSLPPVADCLWVHAASVGEVGIAAILIKKLKTKGETRPIVLSTFTPTGYQQALQENLCPVFRLPPDFPMWIQPLLKKLRPRQLILIEAELWPCLLRTCKQQGVPALLVNGRMTERACSRYTSFAWFFRWMTEGVVRFSMRSQDDANRILKLGLDASRVNVAGNIKFDALAGAEQPDVTRAQSPLLIFGSTRPGDEGPAMEAILKLQKDFPDLRTLIAPRHMERCREVEALIKEYDTEYSLRSALTRPDDPNAKKLILLDTLGELNACYARADAAYVGGGFNPRFGGQNIIEPAGHGIPVLFGPYMNNFEEEARLLVESGGGIQIEQPKDLYPALHRLLTDAGERVRRGQSAAEAVRKNRGAVQRTIEIIHSISS